MKNTTNSVEVKKEGRGTSLVENQASPQKINRNMARTKVWSNNENLQFQQKASKSK